MFVLIWGDPQTTEASSSTWPGTRMTRPTPSGIVQPSEPTLYLVNLALIIASVKDLALDRNSGVKTAVWRMLSRSEGREASK